MRSVAGVGVTSGLTATAAETFQGQEIVALKVTRRAARLRDGRRPAVLYIGAQHAREWITPETVRRLAHHVTDSYGSNRALTKLVDSTELWLVPVANPDGYEHSFTPGNRNWRVRAPRPRLPRCPPLTSAPAAG